MNFSIDNQFILDTKAEIKKFVKGDLIINEGDISPYFLFLVEGELSVFNFTEDGKEFLQHKVYKENFFGESAVLLKKPFPGNVEVSSEKATILKIKLDIFLEYVKKNPEMLIEFSKSLAEKALGRSHSLKNIVFHNPEERIFSQLCEFRKQKGNCKGKILIKLTRKELSYMTGLRTETIIRAVKKMEKKGKLEIRSGKIYF